MELDVDDTDEPELVSVPWSEGSPRFSGWVSQEAISVDFWEAH